GLAEYGKRQSAAIDGAIGAHRSDNAERDADDGRKEDREDRELEGDTDALANQLGNRLIGEQRSPQVAGQRVAGPVEILNVEGTIETVAMRDVGDLGWARVVAGQLVSEITGQTQEGKSDHRHGE